MKRTPAPSRSTAALVAVATLAISVASVPAATKKSQASSKSKPVAAQTSAPAATPAPAPPPAEEKKGMFTRAKEMLGLKKKTPPAVEAPPARTAAAPSPAKKTGSTTAKTKVAPATEKSAPPTVAEQKAGKKGKAAPPPTETAAKSKKAAAPAKPAPPVQTASAEPEKKGWFRNLGIKRLFTRSKNEAPEADQHLANARTARPAPVKEGKPAPKVEPPSIAESSTESKRGFFGFFRKLREPVNSGSGEGEIADSNKIERPTDWEEHKIVTESGTALYTFGPMQPNGPDRRLDSGSLVKVKSIRRGWALVEMDGTAGYIDASVLRNAQKDDFKDPPPPTMMAATGADPNYWAPLAPPPDLPDQPSKADADAALLLLPPLELEPKPKPAAP